MTTIELKSLGKSVELKPYTRSISRKVEEITMEGVMIHSDALGNATGTAMPAINATRAEEAAIQLISGLSNQEMDDISDEDYQKLKKAVDAHTKQKKTTE